MSGTGWKFTSAPTGVTLDALNTSTLAPVNFDVNGAIITLNTSSKAVFTSNVEVQGNLTVNGLTTQIDSTTVTVTDPILKLAKDNSANTLDIGFYGKYVSSGTKYTGLFYDASDSKFKIFTGLTVEPTSTVDTSALSYTPATLVASIEGTVSSIANFTTDNLTEGTTNKYFSNTLAQGAFTAGTGISIVGGTISTTGGSTQWTTTGSDIYYNTGNVGINSSTPGQRLDVGGNVNISTGSTYKIAGNDVLSGTALGTGVVTSYLTSIQPATALTVGVGTSVALNVNSSTNNVGVGTTASATYKLDVNGNVNLLTGNTYKIAGNDVLSGTALGTGVTASSLTSVGNLTSLTVDTNVLVVDASNNRVGIGLTNPAYTLDVVGDVNFTGTLSKSGVQVDTDDIPQGTTNLYYSDTLARGALSAGTGISYNSGSGEISLNVASSTISALNAYATSYASSGSSTDTIQFASGDITLDNSSGWSLVNHNYVIPATGNYRIKFSFTGGIYTPDVSLALVINGTPSTTIKAFDYISGGNIRSTASNEIIRAMTAADTLGIKLIVDRVTYPTSTITLENVSLVINFIPSSTFSSFSGGDVTVTNLTSSGYVQNSINRMTVATVNTTKYTNLHLSGDPDTVKLINLANLSSNDGRVVNVMHGHATGTLTVNIRDVTDTTTVETVTLSARTERSFVFYNGRWY